MDMHMLELSEEQKQMRAVCRDFVDKEVIPYIRDHRDEEWTKPANQRQPWDLLKAADKLGLRALGVPEKYGGFQLEAQAQTFAIIGHHEPNLESPRFACQCRAPTPAR
jgi:alkylation response protein AidB-like acyl-CoA dehydrogenase